jgi:glycine/D-amino acid oxidase-like deaminating enzyme
MDLVSDRPFWLLKNGLLHSYPSLDVDQTCGVAVIGAGITGALIAHRLTEAGLSTIVLDRRDVAQGSTSATTSLMQYEIDVHLTDMAEKVGLDNARRAYLLGLESIAKLGSWVEQLEAPCCFESKRSIYLATRQEDVEALAKECEARQACGIAVEFLGQQQVREQFALPGYAALVSPSGAQLDAYQLTHHLLQHNLKRGLRVFDRTEVTRFEHQPDRVMLHTDRGATITANRLVVAAGYESQTMLREKIVKLKSTYAFVTPPLTSPIGWPQEFLYWESARPYCYMRSTEDNRILFGGEDDDFRNPLLRDASLPHKTEKLLARCHELLPDLTLEAEYTWAGTFGETLDGLPYIGSSPEFPHTYFALGFGGNGISFSVIAAEMMPTLVKTGQHPDAEIFRFGR